MTIMADLPRITFDTPPPPCPSWCNQHERTDYADGPSEHTHRGVHQLTFPGHEVTVDLLQVARSYDNPTTIVDRLDEEPHVVVTVDGNSDIQGELSWLVSAATALLAVLR